ncbi:MAG: metallophosphoesterase [Ruminiclostridium sp.]
MTYVMSDIHGMYEKYMKMLELIGLSGEDTLYILGDVVDRGDKPTEVLLDMMKRPNVYPVMGNHEIMALDTMDIMLGGIEGADLPVPVEEYIADWLKNGGATTIEGFAGLSYSDRLNVIDYISDFSPFEAVDIGEKSFIMVHAGFDNFSPGRKLSDYSIEELVWHRPNPLVRYFEGESIYVVAGHTPTFIMGGEASIIKENGNIFIDCGACSEKGRLACLCLETMEEFYV